MNSHFRPCPKHRKPLPCAHCALAAKPAQAPAAVAIIEPPVAELEIPAVNSGPPVTEPELPVSEPEIPVSNNIAPKKRGRPPKHGVAMTAAERQARSRAKEKQQEDTARRERLITELMRIYDRQQSKVVATKRTKKDPNAEARADDLRAIDKRMREVYVASLQNLPVEELQIALEVNRQTSDTKGRLHNERSGEDKQFKGQTEMEKIVAAKGVQPWYANTAIFAMAGDGLPVAQIDDEHASDLSKQMAGQNKVRAEGSGAADDRSNKEIQNEEPEEAVAPKGGIESGLNEQLLRVFV